MPLPPSQAGNFTPNYPGGMTVVMNTGALAPPSSISTSGFQWTTGGAVPTTMTNQGPSTVSGTGDWAGNLTPVPTGTGIRFNYPSTNGIGGNSPVVVSTSNFASFGTGFLYFARRIRFDSGWSFSKASGIKTGEPATVVAGNNHVFSIDADDTNGNVQSTGWGFPNFILQGPLSGSGDIPGGKPSPGNGLPPYFAAPASVYVQSGNLLKAPNLGNWCTEEWYIQPETPLGTGNNGQLTIWINGIQIWTSVGFNDGTTGQTGINFDSNGWKNIKYDPTYGGDSDPTDHPPVSTFWDMDYLFAAVA